MFIAMNRFRVKKGSEEALEKVWLSRDSQLAKVPGFVEFRLFLLIFDPPQTFALRSDEILGNERQMEWSQMASSPSVLREQAGHITASDFCAGRCISSCQAGAIHT